MLSIIKITFREFSADKVMRLSAALAYYAMFSIGPLLVIAVGVAGFAFGNESVRNQIEEQLSSSVGPNAAKTVESMMTTRRSTSVITTVLGAVALFFGASGVFAQLQDALNWIWKVKPAPGHGLWELLRTRFLSLSLVFGIGFLLLVSLALSTFLSAIMNSASTLLPIPPVLAQALNFAVSFAVVTLLFAMIFKFLPDVKIPFSKVWIGAIATALLFTIGQYLLAFYLGRESTASPYGAAGSVIVIMMWIYYASMILLLGAEFTHVYARETGTKIVPTKFATLYDREQSAGEATASSKPIGNPTPMRPAFPHSPGGVVRREPWQFVMFMLAAGFASGFLYRFRLKKQLPRRIFSSLKH